MAMTFDMVVDYDDGTTQDVRADQRDCVAWEMREKTGTSRAMDEKPMIFFRFITWHAMKRQGLTELGRDAWEAIVISADAKEEPKPADPTNEAPHEGASST